MVYTATTPGIALAAEVSIELILASGYGRSGEGDMEHPVALTSSTYLPLPWIRAGSSRRLTTPPMTLVVHQ